jgi:hypothetical protein
MRLVKKDATVCTADSLPVAPLLRSGTEDPLIMRQAACPAASTSFLPRLRSPCRVNPAMEGTHLRRRNPHTRSGHPMCPSPICSRCPSCARIGLHRMLRCAGFPPLLRATTVGIPPSTRWYTISGPPLVCHFAFRPSIISQLTRRFQISMWERSRPNWHSHSTDGLQVCIISCSIVSL